MTVQEDCRARIVALIDGGPADGAVVSMACLLAKQRHANLYLVRAVVVDRQQALDAPLPQATALARSILERASAAAFEQGCGVETRELRTRDVAEALVDEAADLGCDQIVLGFSGDPNSARAAQVMVDYVLRHAPCPVWLYRDVAKPALRRQ